ncbi:MAG: ATP-binding protein [Ruminococcus sp.]|nr:ATP-binding protein [Ruminococcus sp.]
MFNRTVGNLNERDGINCDKCLNRGYFNYLDEQTGDIFVRECECMKKRNSVISMQKSGLRNLLGKSFGSFNADEPWQDSAKQAAILYTQQKTERWLYMSGVHGCGKTHLCTAVCKALMNKGRNVKYLLWTDISRKLDALKFRYEDCEDYLSEIKNTDVLYIDDFLKNSDSSRDYSEVKKAYIIINARYCTDRKTIISSEIPLKDYYSADGAAAGRIREKSVTIPIQTDNSRDFRFRK